jgi:predicted nucleic acid-binding protein
VKLLLDSSVWLAYARAEDEPDHEAADAIMTRSARGEAELRLLDLTLYELGNVVVCAWKRSPQMAQLIVDAAIDIAGGLPLVPTAAERREAHAMAAEHGLSVYDATYAAVARERRLTLVSGDKALVSAGLAVEPAAV